jgi:hypothetical protein
LTTVDPNKRMSMLNFGNKIRQSLIRQSRTSSLAVTRLATENKLGGETKKTMLAKISERMNFDHLSLREQSHSAYQKINKILRSKNEPIFSKMVFSDYMHKYDVNLKK